MAEHTHWLIDEYPSVSASRRPRDRLLIALMREHGQPRYDYPPQLVRYYSVKSNVAQSRRLAAKNHSGTQHEHAGHAPSSAQGTD